MTVLNNVPYVRNAVLSKVVMVSLRSVESYNVIRSTAGDKYQMRSFLFAVPLECTLCARSGTDSSDIAELVAVLHTYLKRLHTAH